MSKFEINEKIKGFTVMRMLPLQEISAVLYEMSHDLSGAKLIYIDRDDRNKTFAIAFPTLPKNSTGVFHIIEHSVLCGSEKYPLKDPFAELLKGSLNTFLNAMTYEDRTVYPVSSACEKDFMNLTDVYLDAVFSPMMLKNPQIFKQEGWHYEYDRESEKLSISGVVYNEMKGVYSSPDEIGTTVLSAMMNQDTPYGKDSGGDPSEIPSLSYEEFKETYEKHYAPSNARIVLDGSMDIPAVLELIDSHLVKHPRKAQKPEYIKATPKISPPKRISYELPEGEDEKGRTRMLFGYGLTSHDDKLTTLAATVLCDFLCGTNASPLKKELLDRGLAKDAVMYLDRSYETSLTLEIRDTDEEKLSEIESTVLSVTEELSRGGIDHSLITAALDNAEFKQKEQDFGTLPVGVAFALAVYGDWMYGSKPETALLTEEILKELRRLTEEGFFEELLLSVFHGAKRKATVVMIPDRSLSKRLAKEEEDRLASIKNSMSADELLKIEEEARELVTWQEEEETEEALSSLPKLAITDISEKTDTTNSSATDYKNAKILRQTIETNGIVYISLHFRADDLEKDELLPMSILSSLLTNLPTKNRETLTLQRDVKSNLGTFIPSYAVYQNGDVCGTYLKFFLSALSSKKEELLELLRDVLLNTVFDGEKEIVEIVEQARSHLEEAIICSGESVALSRVEAGSTMAGTKTEYLSGYEAYKTLCDITKDENKLKKLIAEVGRIYKKLIKSNRLTLSIAGEPEEGFAERIADLVPEECGEIKAVSIPLCADKEEFFLIPSKVAYAVSGGNLPAAKENLGFLRVARSILSYEYLWTAIRVKNGAYGAGFIPRRDGSIAFYSYRDPSPAASLEIYRESVQYLRDLADSDCDLTKFIIGAIGEYDIITTPKTRALIATRDYLTGVGREDEDKIRRDMLSMTRDDLRICADIIEAMLKNANVVTVGGAEHLETMKDRGMKVITI